MTTMRMKRNLVIMWIQTLAILVFLYGFLPLKEPSEDKATIEDIPKEAQRWVFYNTVFENRPKKSHILNFPSEIVS